MKSIIVLILSSLSMLFVPALSAQTTDTIPTKEDKYQGITITVNINTASLDELSTLLLGVGNKKAQLIIEYREQHGLFETPDDLMKVKGIGPSIVNKNRNRILL